MMTEYKFGSWLPDQTDFKNPGLEDCKNAIPSPRGYQPAPAVEGQGITVSGDVIGGLGFERKDGTRGIAVATTSDLYLIIGGTANASSLSLSLAATDVMTIDQFGPSLYATVKNGDTYTLADVETGTTFTTASGSPPEAGAMAQVGDFLVMGNLIDIDASDAPYRVRWSQFNNPDGAWTTDIATQSGAIDFAPDQGRIVAISGGDFGIIFQQYGITRMTYSGGGAVFAKELFEKNRGCAAAQSVVRVGPQAYFLSNDGFFVTDGSQVVPISRGRIWEWFKENVNEAEIPRTRGAVDWAQRCIVWTFIKAGETTHGAQLYFNWETQDWGYTEQRVDFMVSAERAGVDLETLALTYTNIDTMDISLDSSAFQASGRSLFCFADGELGDFVGPALEAQFESGSVQPKTGHRTFVHAVTPLIEEDTSAITVSIGTRDKMTTTPMFTIPAQQGPLGYVPLNSDGRYHRVRVVVPENTAWENAYGFQIEFEPSGAY